MKYQYLLKDIFETKTAKLFDSTLVECLTDVAIIIQKC